MGKISVAHGQPDSSLEHITSRGNRLQLMRLGKREQLVILLIATAAVIGLVHLLVFQRKAAEYEQVEARYQQGVATLATATVLSSQTYLDNFAAKTTEYNAQVTSIAAQLGVLVPPEFATESSEAALKREQSIIGHIRELVNLRASIRTPQLTFLDDLRTQPANMFEMQRGWNMPRQLPGMAVRGALWDTVAKLQQQWELMSNITDPIERLRQRITYNQLLNQIGLNPVEVSKYVVALGPQQYVFFNDDELFVRLISDRVFNLQPSANPYSLFRMGPEIPNVKKLWLAELIWEQREENTRITREKLHQIMEIQLPIKELQNPLNKQLEALVRTVKVAEANSIAEIQQVRLLKPVLIGKASRRVPGATPAPPEQTDQQQPGQPGGGTLGQMAFGRPGGLFGGAAVTPEITPPPDRVGAGAGLEIWFRGTNADVTKFLFDLANVPGTFAIDDLSIQATQTGEIQTSATIEIVTVLDEFDRKIEAAAPPPPPPPAGDQ